MEGECRILFQGEILLLYYKVYKCWTIGLSKLFEIFIREMYVCGIEEMLQFIRIENQSFK